MAKDLFKKDSLSISKYLFKETARDLFKNLFKKVLKGTQRVLKEPLKGATSTAVPCCPLGVCTAGTFCESFRH